MLLKLEMKRWNVWEIESERKEEETIFWYIRRDPTGSYCEYFVYCIKNYKVFIGKWQELHLYPNE